jgi:hypothetical protein
VRVKYLAVAAFAALLAVAGAAVADTIPTTTETEPAAALTDREFRATTVFETTTVEQLTTVEQVTTVVETAVSPAAAAKAGAAAAQQSQSSSDSTDWGWVAFGILAAAVIGGGTVWLVHRRRPSRGS